MQNTAKKIPDVLNELESRLQEAVSHLEVPPSKYADAQTSYAAVGDWLNADGSSLAAYEPEIYPQGSFALGTAVRPRGSGQYDVDAVCLLQADPSEVSQEELKELVGERLKEHETYAGMIDPKEGGRRCWTLEYADESRFHLDILPAIPDDPSRFVAAGVPLGFAEHAICITDREAWDTLGDWPKSNPKGYARWFRQRMRVILEERRLAVAKRIEASVEQVPDHQVRTPLQQVIQLLKRHRDVRYADDEDKPISIIITTLAAEAYENEPTLVDTLLAVIPKMRAKVQQRLGVWWVPNPVNPEENFADKWAEKPRKAQVFFDWLNAVESEHQDLLGAGTTRIAGYVTASYELPVLESAPPEPRRRPLLQRTSLVALDSSTSLDVPHREAPRWPISRTGNVSITGFHGQNGNWKRFGSGEGPLRKGVSLKFVAKTDVVGPVDVFWQVVNTGKEAGAAGQLRGRLFQATNAGRGGLSRNESTAFSGLHWIECFVVQHGVCLARSGEYMVQVA